MMPCGLSFHNSNNVQHTSNFQCGLSLFLLCVLVVPPFPCFHEILTWPFPCPGDKNTPIDKQKVEKQQSHRSSTSIRQFQRDDALDKNQICIITGGTRRVMVSKF